MLGNSDLLGYSGVGFGFVGFGFVGIGREKSAVLNNDKRTNKQRSIKDSYFYETIERTSVNNISNLISPGADSTRAFEADFEWAVLR